MSNKRAKRQQQKFITTTNLTQKTEKKTKLCKYRRTEKT